ncbi:NYN domain-containing protein [Caballeronia sp. GAWG1-5s-s]|uniref:NYN domain-containing protein n=1 Tax=Caballeronia sp. GAWG1-5s-s TaxID=2921743 RepID=UPI00202785F7|nr:NYN domain-containing protein [Caballeronia sp. GAWG1-5s-s]
MAGPQESVNMALFCDFENVAIGARDAKYERFDIRPVLERLLLKGSIVVKKAYCDWDRYKGFKASMHEASFELIEIPHVRQSGKNSADIRLVVDALDLCYTKSHVDTFVIISGDSDFSPLVSKLRENAKKVIGVGVKQSTSDLLVANCDEFIFYDDLVREQQRASAKQEAREAKRMLEEDRQPKEDIEARKSHAVAIAVETFEALSSERGESGKIWASVLKSAIKRRKPGFSETQYGFRAFGNLLEEAQLRGFFVVGRDDKSGAFVSRSYATNAKDAGQAAAPVAARGHNKSDTESFKETPKAELANGPETEVVVQSKTSEPLYEPKKEKASGQRRARKTAATKSPLKKPDQQDDKQAVQGAIAEEEPAKRLRKPTSRSRASRKGVESATDR